MRTISMTQKIFYGIFLLSTSLLISCGTSRIVAEQPKARTIEILAVNDMHAALDNFPRLAFMADSLRNIYPDLLLVSAGDNQTGNPVNDQYPEKGMPIIELMNALKFNMSAVGNHEYDSRLAGFERITHKANFDFICANIEMPKGSDFRIKPYKIVQSPNGIKTVFVSILQVNSNGIPDTHPDNVKGFIFNDPVKTANDYLFLKDSGDVFIMLNHFGFEDDVALANQLPANVVDVIIGGHSHTKIDKEQIHNDILITQAGSKLKYATLIKLTIDPDGKVEKEMQLLDVGKKGNTNPAIQAKVDAYNSNPAMTKTVAIAEDDFSTKAEIGYMLTDALRIAVGTDIALINSGGVRLSWLDKGPVLTKNVYEMDPFGNEIVQFNLSGHELRNLFLSAYTVDEDLPVFPSGMTLRYLLTNDGKLKDVELYTTDGKPLDMDKMYSVVMNDYMAAVYKYDHKDPGQGLFRPTAETTIEYLKKLKNIPSYRGVRRVEMVKN